MMPEIKEVMVNGVPKQVNFEINGQIYTLGGGGDPVVVPLHVTQNGTYAPPTGTDGYAPVSVNIPSDRKPEQSKTVEVNRNGSVVVEPDGGKVLTSATVNVNVPSDRKPEMAGQQTINANGTRTFSPPGGYVYSSFTVDVQTPAPKPEQAKTVEATANGDVVITPDPGKVLSSATVRVNVQGGAKTEEVRVTAAGFVQTTLPDGPAEVWGWGQMGADFTAPTYLFQGNEYSTYIGGDPVATSPNIVTGQLRNFVNIDRGKLLIVHKG